MIPEEIKALIYELNRLTVSGEANLDILLGCITFLKSKLRKEEGDKDG